MGVSILMEVGDEKWEAITPGWRSAMAEMLREIAGYHSNYLVFDRESLPALRERREKQRIGEVAPPFDRSEEWVECFDRIIARIEKHGTALVQLSY